MVRFGRWCDRERCKIEHQMRYHCATDAAKTLNHDVGSDLAPLEFSSAGKHQSDSGVEVGARDRTNAYAKLNNLAFVLLQNHDGAFVAPGSQSFQSAAGHADWASPTAFYVLLADQPGSQSWPISGSTFVLVYKNQSKPGVARELLKFFDWAYHDGAKLAEGLDYVPMPQAIVQLVESSWTAIKQPDGGPAWKGVAVPQH